MTKKRTRGAPCCFKCKQVIQGRKRQGRQITEEKDKGGRHAVSSASKGSREENVRGAKLTEKRPRGAGAMQFQVQAGAPGKKTSGVPN